MSEPPCAKELKEMIDALTALQAAGSGLDAFATTEPLSKTKNPEPLEFAKLREALERETAALKSVEEKVLAYAECRKRRGL